MLAVQLARREGADVIGIASPDNADWLTAHGIRPVATGTGWQTRCTRRLRAASTPRSVDYGDGYVGLAGALGVPLERIVTTIDFDGGRPDRRGPCSGRTPRPAALARLAGLTRPARSTYAVRMFPLDRVREAYVELEKRHTRGKIVLVP